MEVDILGDGSMDMPNEILKQLDIVLATIHSRMNMPKDEMTDRILKALDNPYVKILGHPTGRQLLRRDPYQFDMEKVFDAAKRRGVVVEVNANPERLDPVRPPCPSGQREGVKSRYLDRRPLPRPFRLHALRCRDRPPRLD